MSLACIPLVLKASSNASLWESVAVRTLQASYSVSHPNLATTLVYSKAAAKRQVICL